MFDVRKKPSLSLQDEILRQNIESPLLPTLTKTAHVGQSMKTQREIRDSEARKERLRREQERERRSARGKTTTHVKQLFFPSPASKNHRNSVVPTIPPSPYPPAKSTRNSKRERNNKKSDENDINEPESSNGTEDDEPSTSTGTGGYKKFRWAKF